EVPAGSLLATCFARGDRVEIAPQSDYDQEAKEFLDRLKAPTLEFAVDERDKRVLFRGGHYLHGANYRIVKTLLEKFRTAKDSRAEVEFTSPNDPADKLKVDGQSMRQQLSRLRRALDPLAVALGIPLDQDSFIETRERAGYRLSPV